jgi:hypothetical protein
MESFEVDRIKQILGLPPEAGTREIEARIAELMQKCGMPITLPPEEKPDVPAQEKGTLVTELSKMEYEPLLPVEKKLISWSIALGVVGLGILVWLSHTFFPAGH